MRTDPGTVAASDPDVGALIPPESTVSDHLAHAAAGLVPWSKGHREGSRATSFGRKSALHTLHIHHSGDHFTFERR
jgi:hypothetical protein